MRHSNLTRATAIAALVLAVSLALSGCATFVGSAVLQGAVNSEKQHKAEAKAAADKGEPATGDCWVATVKYADYANWGSRKPVSCSQPHQLYSYSVRQLESKHTGSLYTSSGYLRSAISDDVDNTCGDGEPDALASVSEVGLRVEFEDYVPENSEWKAGARWVRCDIGVIKLGSTVTHPVFENLPPWPTLEHEIKSQPNLFNFCTTGPSAAPLPAPRAANAVYADCRGNPDWTLESFQSESLDVSTNYPTAAQWHAAYVSYCESVLADATHVTYAYYPSKSQWDDGTDNSFECWIGRN